MKHILFYCEKTFTDHIIAVYFFNARGNKLEKTPLGMLRSLLYQLLDQDPLLCERFIPMFLDKQKKHENGWEWQVGELKSFLLSEMKKFQSKPLLLLIDALDECDESEVREVIVFLESLSMNAVGAKITLNICLSSRHYPNISMEKRLELIVEEEKGHDQDIAKYVQHKLRIRDKEIEEELLQKAAHIFLWVVLVVEMLNQVFDHGKVRAMQRKLGEVPSDLDEVFGTLLDKDNPDKQETILILQWVLFAGRLLKPEELYFAVLAGTEPEELGAWNRSKDTNEVIKRFITSTSKGLIEIRKGRTETVQFIHESVKDFLLRNKRLQTLDPTLKPYVIGASHDRLIACCMSYIAMKELEPFGTDRLHIEMGLALNYPFLEYVSTYVLYHAEEAQVGCIAQQALVRRLQQPHREFERLRSFHDFLKGWNASYGMGAGLLYALSFHGYYELVQMVLLEKGANVNAQGGHYGTALQAASYKGHDQVVQRLLEKGADVNAQGGHYGNALQAASVEGHDQVVQRLLEKGADVNAQGGYYGTALQAASAGGHDQIVQRLLEKGADVNAQGGEYGNALQAASYWGPRPDRPVAAREGGRRQRARRRVRQRAAGGFVRATTRSSSGCSRKGPTSTRREDTTATRYRRLRLRATTRSSSGCSRRAPTSTRKEDYGNALQAASVEGHDADRPAAAREGGRRQRARRSTTATRYRRLLQGPRPDRPAAAREGGRRQRARRTSTATRCMRLPMRVRPDRPAAARGGGRRQRARRGVQQRAAGGFVSRATSRSSSGCSRRGPTSTRRRTVRQRTVGGFGQGHDQVVQRLLEKGADVKAQGGLYGSALQAASSVATTRSSSGCSITVAMPEQLPEFAKDEGILRHRQGWQAMGQEGEGMGKRKRQRS